LLNHVPDAACDGGMHHSLRHQFEWRILFHYF
jgi:hypothetical protein